MIREEFENWAFRHGYVKDHWGHLRKNEHRIKLSRIAARLEWKSAAGWVRLRSAYFSKLAIVEGDKISGMK